MAKVEHIATNCYFTQPEPCSRFSYGLIILTRCRNKKITMISTLESFILRI